MKTSPILGLLALAGLAACGPQGPKPIDIMVIHGGGPIKAGMRMDTPCYSVVIPVDSQGVSSGCNLSVSPAGSDPEAQPLTQYFSFGVLTDPVLDGQSLDQKMQQMLETIRRANGAQTGQDPRLAAIYGPNDNARGFFQGVKTITVAGHPAREALWGYEQADPRVARLCRLLVSSGRACPSHMDDQSAVILIDAPPSRFTLDGKPVSTFMITGAPRGPRAPAYQSAIDHLALKF